MADEDKHTTGSAADAADTQADDDAPEDEAGTAEGGGGPGPAGPTSGPRGMARGTRWGAATATYVLVVVAVLVAINLVGAQLKTSWDLTANHQLTLTQASKNIIAQLRQPVHIIAFEQPGDLNATQVKSLLQQYAAASHGRITYQVVDPAAQRALAVKYNVNAYGSVVVQSGSNVQMVQESDMTTFTATGTQVFDGEGAITNAIIRAASPVQFKVDFLSGDGEPDITAGDLPDAVQALKDQGYTVNALNLLASGQGGVPTDVSCLIVITPQQDLSPSEISALKAYAAAGGHLLFMIDPTTKPLPNLDALLAGWGVTPQNDLVVDSAQHYGTDPTSIVPTIAQAPITQPLQQAHLGVLLIAAQGLTLKTSTPGYTVTPLLTSTAGTAAGGGPASWGVGDLASLQQNPNLAYDPKRDIAGPITLAASVMQNLAGSGQSASTSAAATGTSTTSAGQASGTAPTAASLGQTQFRAVVFGNSAFIASAATGQANGPINVQGNKDLFLNAVGWLTGRQEGIAVRPHSALDTSLFLTGGKAQALIDTFVIGLPLVCFALAFSTWWSRRRL